MFLPATGGVKSADALIDDELWEMKRPTGSSPDSISRNIRAARKQSRERVLLDISDSPLLTDEIITLAEAAASRYHVPTVWIVGRGLDHRIGGG